MNMKKQTFSLLAGAVLAVALLLVSCHSSYEVTKVEGGRIPMNSVWDAEPDAEAVALLAPYKARMDSVMYHVVGTAEMSMDRFRPESLLSNLIADVLREAAVEVLGKPADMGLINIGGIRNSLTEGDITTENIYEILPFENSLCVLTMKGSAMKHLFENIAVRLGEGVYSWKSARMASCSRLPLPASRWRMTVTIRLPRLIIWLMETME
jgi:2',3'-cyclic-nucleotide 2'-phosphodiesterase (5'-nucleotidase family)